MRQVALWDAARRRELFQETAAQRGVNPAIIEKDFWVCWVLSHLFGDADPTEIGSAINTATSASSTIRFTAGRAWPAPRHCAVHGITGRGT